jgi:hypothetical protein
MMDRFWQLINFINVYHTVSLFGFLGLPNDTLFSKCQHLSLAILQVLLKDLIRMLPQHGRDTPNRRRRLRQLNGRVDHLNRPALFVLQLNHHVSSLGVLVIQGPLDVVDRGVGHALALEDLEPLLRRLGLGDDFDSSLEFLAVGDSVSVGLVP